MSKKSILLRIFLVIILVLVVILILFNIFLKDNKDNSKILPTATTSILPFSIDSKNELKNTWEKVLVNKDTLLPENWKIDVVEINNVPVLKKEYINKKIIKAFNNLINAANKNGTKLLVISSYRSISDQENVYNSAVNQYQNTGYTKEDAIKQTEKTINKPRSSEHHTGLAIDIVGVNAWKNIGNLDERLADTPEFKWLENNAYKYGFILRYPKDKVNETKVNYEPWHFRYVGVNLATYLTKNHLTLEEYHKLKN